MLPEQSSRGPITELNPEQLAVAGVTFFILRKEKDTPYS